MALCPYNSNPAEYYVILSDSEATLIMLLGICVIPAGGSHSLCKRDAQHDRFPVFSCRLQTGGYGIRPYQLALSLRVRSG